MNPVIRYLRSVAGQSTARLDDAQLLERFLVQRDEVAFETLVRRHGAMVLGVCRRILKNAADAEDAFQATFLVLVRKAATISKRQTVGGWLYGVAYKTALKARAANNQRRTKERQAADMAQRQSRGEEMERELLARLDAELSCLPDKYRVPIVLCDLEGKMRKEAAKQLGWPEGTLSGRLARGRALLAKRLRRHGLTLTSVAVGMTLTSNTASACIPPLLVSGTVKAASCLTVGQAVTGCAISARAAALADRVIKSMLLTKLKIATVVLLIVGALGVGAASRAVPQLASLVWAASPGQLQAPSRRQKVRAAAPARPAVLTEAERAIRTDDAVAAGLQWLVQQQQRDGRWRMELGTQRKDIAATALALLPLLEAGETPKSRGALHPYARSVERGLRFLMSAQDAAGYFGPDMYCHALAARAVCTAYRLTEEAALKKSAQRAIDLIVKTQDDKGGWRYAPMKQPGDTSVTSYQILALDAARRAGLKVPDKTLTDAGRFLDSVAAPDGAGYGYVPGAGGPTPTMSAAGHLCRLVLGGKADDRGLVRWAAATRNQAFPKDKNHLYYYYYVTEALRRRGGDDWALWEKRIRAYVLDKQDQGANRAAARGSWPPGDPPYGGPGGRLLMTSLALLTLQTCARTDKLPPWPARALKGRELAALYALLGDEDFVKARRALRTLAASPEDSVPFLGAALRPAPPVDAGRIKRLIADLESDSFAVREQATAELKKLAELAHPALRQALADKPTLEVRRRIEQVLEATDLDKGSAAQRQTVRAVEVLVQAGTAEARRLLEKLAGGAPESLLTIAAKSGLQRLSKRSRP
jgi:RNA polymerase sigma factor (sigma-70 family)